MLLIDNCPAHPSAELLQQDNVYAVYLPPNCTSVIQPMDQGILRSFKCQCKNECLHLMLDACNSGIGPQAFQKTINIKDALWRAEKVWERVTQEVLINGWHNKLWAFTLFLNDEDDDTPNFRGFSISPEKLMVNDLLNYAKGLTNEDAKILDEEDVQECLNVDCDAPVTLQLTDSEIMEMVMRPENNEDTSDEDIDEETNNREEISIEKCISYTEELIKGLEKKSFITEQHIMGLYKIQEVLLQNKKMKQLTLHDMFRKNNDCSIDKSDDFGIECSTSSKM